jgi:hypothetical protein|tara:strand:+ start:412 stop:984 length:573 start_codon:yes stop_codon:yes gene_type:complete
MDVLKNNFWYVPEILTKEELRLLNIYCQIKHSWNYEQFDDVQTALGETAIYGDTIMESLLKIKTPNFEKVIGKKILPTYSFWRMYNKFSVLNRHLDRPSCEITASINLGGCGTKWPLIVEGKSVDIKPGDAVVYHGAKLEHWREEFQGDAQAQVFFHWVYADGPEKGEIFDRRKDLGDPARPKVKLSNNA